MVSHEGHPKWELKAFCIHQVVSQVDFVGGQFRMAGEHNHFLLLLAENVALLSHISDWVLMCTHSLLLFLGS
jgi:hypothetical protein